MQRFLLVQPVALFSGNSALLIFFAVGSSPWPSAETFPFVQPEGNNSFISLSAQKYFIAVQIGLKLLFACFPSRSVPDWPLPTGAAPTPGVLRSGFYKGDRLHLERSSEAECGC